MKKRNYLVEMITHPATGAVSHKRVLAVCAFIVTAILAFLDAFNINVDHIYVYGMFSLALGQSGYTLFEDKQFKHGTDTNPHTDTD